MSKLESPKAKRKQTPRRFKSPTFSRAGRAQLSIIETALSPLTPSRITGPTWETSYSFGARNNRKQASVRVFSPLGFQPTDNYPLWALLSLTFDKCGDEPLLLTNPNYCLDYLGYSHGGSGRRLLFEQLDRLAAVSYHNDNFYNPLTESFQRVAFGFFSIWVPRDLDSELSWGIQWDAQFYAISRASGGSLRFDLDLFKKHTPSARQLLLKVQDRFYRFTQRDRFIVYSVDELTRQLGYCSGRLMKKRKASLKQNIAALMEDGIFELGRGQASINDLFFKRSAGEWYVRLYPGPYFHTPVSRAVNSDSATDYQNDPLYGPLRRIGFDDADVVRVLRKFSKKLIQRKVRTTELAMTSPPGFAGFTASPAAYCYDQLQHERPTPEWEDLAYDREKLRHRDNVKVQPKSHKVDNDFYEAKSEALSRYIHGKGAILYASLIQSYRQIHVNAGSEQPDQEARQSALTRISNDYLGFMSLEQWRDKANI